MKKKGLFLHDDHPPDGRGFVQYRWEQMPDLFGYWDAMQPAFLN